MKEEFDYSKTYFKVTNKEENHNGMQYKTGVNIDILPFDNKPNNSCCKGGMYFTDEKNLLSFFSYGINIRPLKLKKGTPVILDKQGDKFRTCQFTMKKKISFFDFLNKYFPKECGSLYLQNLTVLPENTVFPKECGFLDLQNDLKIKLNLKY